MRPTLSLLVALSLTCGISAALAKLALDAAGKCRDNGKFVTAALCQAAAPAGRCRDIKTKKFAKCGTANTEPLPASK
jgi:hypothetical protein